MRHDELEGDELEGDELERAREARLRARARYRINPDEAGELEEPSR